MDENTVDFILKQPDPVLLTKLAGYGAMIVPPKYIQEKGEDNFNTHPVGTGPFVRELPAQGQRDPGAQRRILGRQARWTSWSTVSSASPAPRSPSCRPAASTSPR